MNAEELGHMVDAYAEQRELRLAADRTASQLKLEENHLKDLIIHEFQACDVHMVGGIHKKVTMRTKDKPMVNDWGLFSAYVIENQCTALYQKRISEAVANEMMEDGLEIPGVELYEVTTLSVSKL
jgi:hypothetical protein